MMMPRVLAPAFDIIIEQGAIHEERWKGQDDYYPHNVHFVLIYHWPHHKLLLLKQASLLRHSECIWRWVGWPVFPDTLGLITRRMHCKYFYLQICHLKNGLVVRVLRNVPIKYDSLVTLVNRDSMWAVIWAHGSLMRGVCWWLNKKWQWPT